MERAAMAENPVFNTGRDPNGRFNVHNPTAWRKGVCQNPRGRRAGQSLTDVLQARIKLVPRESKTGVKDRRTSLERVADALIAKAVDGHIPAISEIFDRLEGRPRQSVSIASESASLRELAEIDGIPPAEIVSATLQMLEEAFGDINPGNDQTDQA
jgi:Family of unknown function (DUF5681)